MLARCSSKMLSSAGRFSQQPRSCSNKMAMVTRFRSQPHRWRSTEQQSTKHDETHFATDKSMYLNTLKITDDCAQRIKLLSDKKGTPVVLRVEVQGSGCKGFAYKFSIADKVEENDIVFDKNGSKVVVDKESVAFLKDAVVDFQHAMIKEAFKIQKNDAAESSCSCGSSFTPKM